jgi:predicted RNA-binding Zn ribbon-like protein
MPRYDIPKAAPEPLRLIQRFVNTTDHENQREWLGEPRELEEWLAGAGFPVEGEIGPSDLARALELREGLRALLSANNGAPVRREAVDTVNRAAAAARLAVELDADARVRFAPYGHGIDAALGQIVAVALATIADGSWRRLKTCPNCRWAFHDYSRNRSARWCSMQLCGNRLKTRSYRARKSRS